MNYKFRKKPIVIEAFQMTKERRWNNADWPEWIIRGVKGEIYPCKPDIFEMTYEVVE